MIDSVQLINLNPHYDERGFFCEIARYSQIPVPFVQWSHSFMHAGVVKAWHYHEKQWDHFVCVRGMMKVVLYDSREESDTRGEINEFFMGEHQPVLLQIPPLVYHGFKCVSDCEAIVINCPTEAYNYEKPDEFRVDPHDPDIPYDWARKDG